MDQNTVYQTAQPTLPDQSEFIPQQPKKSPFPKLFVITLILLFLVAIGALVWYVIVINPEVLRLGSPIENGRNSTVIEPSPLSATASPSAQPTAELEPGAEAVVDFSFYDSSVWLNPDYSWNKVPVAQMELSEQALFIQSEAISFTAVPVQGNEWLSQYQVEDSEFYESGELYQKRMAIMGWTDKITSNDVVFSPIIADGPGGGSGGFVRAKDGLIQVYVTSSRQIVATDSASPVTIEERIFLSDPLSISELLKKYGR